MCAQNQPPSSGDGSDNFINNSSNLVTQHGDEASDLCSTIQGWAGGVRHDNHEVTDKCAAHILRRGLLENKSSDLCAVFEFSLADQEFKVGSGGDFMREASLPETAESNLQQSVLVNVIQFPEQPEKRREFWVRAIVRLYSLDSCPHSKTQSRNPLFGVMKLTSVASQGEGELIGAGRGFLPRLMDGDCVDQVVEGGTKIVDAVPDLKGQSLEIGSLGSVENPTMFGTIGLDLLGDAVVFRLQSGSRACIDGIEMFLGAAQFGVNAG
jgi:hypothetical protein